MVLLHISLNGLKQSSRQIIVKHFEMLSARSRPFHREILRTSYRSHRFHSIESSCTLTLGNTSKSHMPQSHTGMASSAHFLLSKRAMSTEITPEQKGHNVYVGRVHRLFRNIKILSLTTSAIGLMLQPHMWYIAEDLNLLAKIPLFTAVNLFIFTNPILIHFLSKRYVNELYFNPKTKEFTATVLTFFARKETLTFTADEVTVPDIPGLFSLFTVKDRPLYVDERDFENMEIYKHLLGFDKPLDLRYESNPSKHDDKID